MAAAISPTSGHSSQAIAPLSGEARSRVKKYVNELRDDLDDPALKTDVAFRKILEDGFFEFIELESQVLTAEEKEKCQRTYPLNKRLFNHDGIVFSFILEEMRFNQSKRPTSEMSIPLSSVSSQDSGISALREDLSFSTPPIASREANSNGAVSCSDPEPTDQNSSKRRRLRTSSSPSSALPEGSDTPIADVSPVPAPPFPPAVPLIAFGKRKWGLYFGDIGEAPPLPPDIYQILQSECPIWPGKKIQESHMLVLIPATVNGSPFTLDALEQFIQNPKQGHATKYQCYWDKAKKELGNQSCAKSYWALMTKDVLPYSSSKTYTDQCKLVQNYGQKAKVLYQVPSILEAAASILLEHVQGGTRLYSNNPFTYTHCHDKVEGFQVAVGGFGPAGFNVDYSRSRGYVDNVSVGVAVVRKL